jgi:hypothetical protein
MNEDSSTIRVPDLPEALPDDLGPVRAALREAAAQFAELEAQIQCEDRRIAEDMAALGSTSAEIGAGVQRQGMRIAALMAAMFSLGAAPNLENAEFLERVEAMLERVEPLRMRWDAQGTAVKAWRAQLAASMRHDDQSWVVSLSWSPWTGLAAPVVPPIVQRK